MATRKERSCNIARGLEDQLVKIETVTADPANLRKHGERSIEAIKASFARFGQQKPIVIDAQGVTVAGAGQLEAARQLGWTHIAAVRSTLSGVERVAYAIADNRTAELSEWDQDALSRTLDELGGDLDATGFTAEDLEDLRAKQDLGVTQDEIPSPKAPGNAVSRTGDVWHLGAHRILVGDSTIEADVARIMDGGRAALVATDPPYLVGYDGTNHPQSFTGGGNRGWSDTYGTTWDDDDPDSPLYQLFIKAAVEHAAARDAAWYVWHASRRQAMLEAALQAAGILVHCQIIWAKNRPVLTRTWYMWQHEPCLMGWLKGHKPPKRSDENHSTVWQVDTLANGDERPEHPTPKPIELYAIPIQQHTHAGELVFEPFAGSGTAIIACEQLGRACRSIEKQPIYVDVCIERWQKLTGQTARLGADGPTYDQVRQERASCPSAPRECAATADAGPSPSPGTARRTKSSTSKRPGRARRPQRTREGTEQAGGN